MTTKKAGQEQKKGKDNSKGEGWVRLDGAVDGGAAEVAGGLA